MGRTVIDSLVLELGFDTQGMEQGRRKVSDAFKKTRDEASNSGKTIDESSKKSQQYLEKLRNNIVALFGAFTAGKGLKEFVSDMTSADAALGRFAKSVGATTTAISTMRNAGSLLGIDPGEIDSTFAGYNQMLQDFKMTGQGNSLTQSAVALKINLIDPQTGKPFSADEYLDRVRTALKATPLDDAGKANIYQRIGASQGYIQILESTDEVYNRIRESQKKLTDLQNADLGPAAARQEAWANFKNQLSAVGLQILITVTPALLAMTQAATSFAEFLQDNPSIAGGIFVTLGGALTIASIGLAAFAASSAWAAIAGGLGVIGGGVRTIILTLSVLTVDILPALSAAFYALDTALLATPIGWIIAGITALGFIAFWLYNHWSTVKGWWHDLFGGMADDTEDAADRIAGAKKKMSEPQKPTRGADQPKPVSAAGGGANANAAAWQAALETEQKYGIPASVSYAQYQLESAGGKRMPAGSNNPFGIKANKSQVASGQFVEAMTNEQDKAGVNHRVLQKFAKYDSIRDAFEAHAKLLATSKYYANARKFENDPDKFADALTGVYASDKQYGAKLKKLMHADAPVNPSADTRGALAQATTSAPVPVTVTNGQQAAVNNNSSAQSVSTTSSETNIGQMHVHSAIPNAAGAAGDIKQALARDNFVNQSNSGPT